MNAEKTPRIHVPATGEPLPGERGAGDRTVALDPSPDEAGFEASHAALPQSLFSQYAVIDKIGDGGMGVVYLARDRRLGRFVAIKRLNDKACNNPSLRRRFLQEARAVAALNHIHIVHVYALGEDADGPYIVMEYVPGPDDATEAVQAAGDLPNAPYTLERRILSKGQLSVSEACELLIKIGRAIAYAHSCRVIHRDLKPTNVLLDRSNEPKIVDFGLARLMREEEQKLTVTGEKLLSLGYGAPEQESDAGRSDERADVYGLGALLFFAITGQNPRYYREQDVPAALGQIIGKALATNREHRWPTAAAFTEALIEAHTRTRVEQPTVKTTWRCKWCDTVNPLTIRYCAECGWDGAETCPECGNETFVGIQYCGTCGADARAYEALSHLLEQMRRERDRHQFERVIALAGRLPAIEPTGPVGRDMLHATGEMKREAERDLARRDHLKRQVPVEIKAENFERALTFIAEFEALSGDRSYFEPEKKRIPGRLARRDLRRAEKALKNGRSEQAERICLQLREKVGKDHPECRRMLREIRHNRRWHRFSLGMLSALLLFFLYLAALAPAARLFPSRLRNAPLRKVFAPARWLHTAPYLEPVFSRYHSLWNVPSPDEFAARFPDPDPPAREIDLPELTSLKQTYHAEAREIVEKAEIMDAQRPEAYLQALEGMMERRRMAGDFENWDRIHREFQRFSETGVIGAPESESYPELQELKRRHLAIQRGYRLDKFRRLIALNRKYINDLTDLRRGYTRAGHMEAAAVVNEEIHRARSTPEIREAEKELASLENSLDEDLAKIITVSESEQTAELEKIHSRFTTQIEAIHQELADFVEQRNRDYPADLEKLMERFRDRGSFEGWESVSAEAERFEIERRLSEEDVVAAPEELARLQQQYIERMRQAERDRAQRILALRDRFVAQLGKRLTALTKAGNMSAASLVNAEIRRVNTDPAIARAQAELAPAPQDLPTEDEASPSPR